MLGVAGKPALRGTAPRQRKPTTSGSPVSHTQHRERCSARRGPLPGPTMPGPGPTAPVGTAMSPGDVGYRWAWDQGIGMQARDGDANWGWRWTLGVLIHARGGDRSQGWGYNQGVAIRGSSGDTNTSYSLACEVGSLGAEPLPGASRMESPCTHGSSRPRTGAAGTSRER